MSTTAMTALREFLALQAMLLRALQDAYGTLVVHDLASIPASGRLDAPSGAWQFQRHGNGVSFRRELDGCTIDVHVRAEEPAAFDVWRLETYFASLGRRGIKIMDRACGTQSGSLRQKLTLWLQQLEEAGSITALDGIFFLRNDQGPPPQAR